MPTINLRLRLHRPTQTKIRRYRELVERTTAFANHLVAAGRPKGLTSRTAREYLAGDLPSVVINQALRDVAAHRDVRTFRVLARRFPKALEAWEAFLETSGKDPPVSLVQ